MGQGPMRQLDQEPEKPILILMNLDKARCRKSNVFYSDQTAVWKDDDYLEKALYQINQLTRSTFNVL